MIISAKRIALIGYSVAGLLAVIPLAGQAAGPKPISLSLKNHVFTPRVITIPAKTRVRVEVTNLDATPAEFESGDLKVEKIIVPGGKISVFIGPLKPGTYKFFDEYHPDTATGTVHVN